MARHARRGVPSFALRGYRRKARQWSFCSAMGNPDRSKTLFQFLAAPLPAPPARGASSDVGTNRDPMFPLRYPYTFPQRREGCSPPAPTLPSG
jgi:hypothetical protein